MINLIKRNLLYTIRDRVSFAMSFISVAILILMYKLFLNDLQVAQLQTVLHRQTLNPDGVRMINFWLISGLVVVTLVTAAINGLNILVEDRVSGKRLDFIISGVQAYRIQLAYLISAIILTFITTLATLILGILIFVGWSGLMLFSFKAWIQLVGLLMLGSVLSCLLIMPWVGLMKSLQSFSLFSTLIGTLIGFVSGIYLPLGSLSTSLQKVILGLPFVHEGALFKRILMNPSAQAFFKGAPGSAKKQYDVFFGNQLTMVSGHTLSLTNSLGYLLVWLVLGIGLTGLSYWWLKRH